MTRIGAPLRRVRVRALLGGSARATRAARAARGRDGLRGLLGGGVTQLGRAVTRPVLLVEVQRLIRVALVRKRAPALAGAAPEQGTRQGTTGAAAAPVVAAAHRRGLAELRAAVLEKEGPCGG